MMRIAKFLSRYGVCSRREAERCIDQGRVRVNGQVINTPAIIIDEVNDSVEFDGVIVGSGDVREPTKLWLYNKPLGVVSSHIDPKGRPTIMDFARERLGVSHIISVGRLDINSEGLLLLTNNGELSRHLELPSTGWRRRYRVKVFGKLNESSLAGLRNGCVVDGVRYGSIEVVVEKRGSGSNHWLQVSLREGKNREIRKVMAHLGLEVSRLIRISYGPFQLGTLAKGDIKAVPESMLRNFLGSAVERIL